MTSTAATAFQRISATSYVMLVTNVLIGVLALPAVILYLTTDLADTWHALVLAAPLAAPLARAAFRVLAEFTIEGSTAAVRCFVRALLQGFAKAVMVGVQATLAAVVLLVDIAVAWGTWWGAVAIPVLVVLALSLVATTATVLVALAEEPEAKLTLAWKAALFLSIRRWYLSALSLVVLAVMASVVLARPAIGLGLTCTPALYVVWTNARFALRPVLADDTALPAW